MGRGVEPCADTRRTQSRFDHGASGALSVGTGYVHETAGALRIAQLFREGPNGLKTELRALYFVAEGIEIPDRIRIVHEETGPQKNSSDRAM